MRKHVGLLTAQEKVVLPLVVEGLSNEEIGARLGVSGATANFHVRSLLRKFGVTTRTELAVKAIVLGRVMPTAADGEHGSTQPWVCADALAGSATESTRRI